jgi:hypothetical protein
MTAVQVSLDPWHAFVELAPGSRLTLHTRVPGHGWVSVDLTPTTIFVNGWPGTSGSYEVRTAAGDLTTADLPAPEAPAGNQQSPVLTDWATAHDAGSRKYVLHAEVPLTIGRTSVLDRRVGPAGAIRALVATQPDDDVVHIQVADDGVHVDGGAPLLHETDLP